jgi:hypothetical protein
LRSLHYRVMLRPHRCAQTMRARPDVRVRRGTCGATGKPCKTAESR